ncbi:MAG: PorV/PorQ family protein [Candidatus Marinimicrobia bacterium]|nr:PorV/PorQ family protein [Candidatus Neomarinimicrobiota bacterium]MBT3823599.1 PorV/PorQ family protein [Candidatus Neomarinimicrobiota bacterium]MBT4129542.1 PorV/PorQ family protein [Candidatus Neomarinimicrobiota bacterium]MBT4295932.1 PorV/PorQ family protein [Candidatus Neomarinimicrobiota bacterium]MBT4420066.1 PorV/PorQ family protein [Candidatus Neomarinimicrobiota bacterium]
MKRRSGRARQVIICAAIFLSSVMAQEKVGTTAFQFLKVNPTARSAAMGDAISSFVDGASAMFINPAGLTDIDKLDLSASHFNYFFDVKTSAFSAAYNFPNFGTVGMMAQFTDYGEMNVTSVDAMGYQNGDFNPGLTGETFNPGHQIIGLSYAASLTNKFAFGLTAKQIKENADYSYNGSEMSASLIAFDTGLQYKTGYESVKISMVLRHFGKDVSFIEYEDTLRIFHDSTYTDEIKTVTGKQYPLPQILVMGISGYVFGPKDAILTSPNSKSSLLFAVDMLAPRDYDQQFNFGLEYAYDELLFVRSGYKLNYDTENWSLGFGLHFKGVQVDYSFNNYDSYLGAINRFSLGMTL